MKKIFIIGTIALGLSSCTKDPNSPGYEYMPDMYRSPAVEAYVDYGLVGDKVTNRLKNTQSARIPVEKTIPFNKDNETAKIMMPMSYEINELDKADSSLTIPPSYLSKVKDNIKEGKRLYNIFCMHCHGEKGQGDGKVVTIGGFNQPSPYNGAYKDRSLGEIFHVITYGKGAMGSHASQLNKDERWKVAMYVNTLQNNEDS